MKIRLQNFDTGLFVNEAGGWTADEKSAREFLNVAQAAEFQFGARLAHTFVVVAPDSASGFHGSEVPARLAKMSRRAKNSSRELASKMTRPFREALWEVASTTAESSREAARRSLMGARRRVALAMES